MIYLLPIDLSICWMHAWLVKVVLSGGHTTGARRLRSLICWLHALQHRPAVHYVDCGFNARMYIVMWCACCVDYTASVSGATSIVQYLSADAMHSGISAMHVGCSRVPTGPEKSSKVLTFEFSFFRTWKVLKLDIGAEKVLIFASVFLKNQDNESINFSSKIMHNCTGIAYVFHKLNYYFYFQVLPQPAVCGVYNLLSMVAMFVYKDMQL